MILAFFLITFVFLLILLLLIVVKSTITLRMSGEIGTEHMEASVSLLFRNRELRTWQVNEKSMEQFIMEERTGNTLGGKHERSISHRTLWHSGVRLIHIVHSLHLRDKVMLRDFHWQTCCGTGEAHMTAISCGLIWSVKSALVPLIGKPADKRLCIDVIPLFQGKQFSSRLSCMVTIHTGEAIRALQQIMKQMKEGENGGRSPDSGTDENGARKSSGHGRRRYDYRRSN